MRTPLRIWLTEDELEAVRAAARVEHRNVGAWIRDLLVREARQALRSWRRAA